MEERHPDTDVARDINDAHDPNGKPVGGGALPSRREFLAGALTVSGLAFAFLPDSASAQPATTAPPELQPIREIESKSGKLQAVITVRSEKRRVPRGVGAAVSETPIRYFEGRDAAGNLVWPLEASPPGTIRPPLPGPTLRARVGDQVEITFLNHVDVAHFAETGIDNAETGKSACDTLFDGSPARLRLYPDIAGDAPTDGSPRNCFHASSTVNMHFHGTHVTPDGLGDNVLLQLRPDPSMTADSVKDNFAEIFKNGPPARWNNLPEDWRNKQIKALEEYDKTVPAEFGLSEPTKKRIDRGLWPQFQIGAYPYCFKLTQYTENAKEEPDPYQMGQCPGTHWYHAHKHGSTALNVLNGMAGVFVIEGSYDDDLKNIYPDLKKTEKVLIVQNFGEAPNLARGNLSLDKFFAPPSLLVNGDLRPIIRMQPGEIQLWRLVNASIRAVTTLIGFTPKDGAVPEIRQIAQDGVQFHEANYINQPLLRLRGTGTPSNTFAPGNRVDLLVRAPLRPGPYAFRVSDTARINFPRDEVLLTLEVGGTPLNPQMEFPTIGAFGNYPKFPKFLKDIPADKIRIWRNLDFGWKPADQVLGTGKPRAPTFTINGQQFVGGRYDQTMILGDFEEWTLTNSTARIAHPFHIHVNPFQVVEIYDPNSPDQLYKPDKNFVWHDVIAIPPAKSDPKNPNKVLIDPLTGTARDPGYVKIRHPFVDFPGSYVLHCHMLAHEDRGMMQLVRVIRGNQAIPSHEEESKVPHH